IRLLVRGNKKPTFLDSSGSDSKKHTISAEKQQAVSIMRRIYVGSINFNVTEDMLKAAFSAFGPVRTVNMSIDVTTNRHKGFAFIEMETPEAAFLSMAQMNGVMLGGRNIKVGRPSNMPQYDPLINQLTNESKDYARIYVCSIDPELSE
ncbi:MAG: Poly(U)-binding-splicing factor puf60, partial [Paramarteilia canceri]